MMVRRFKKKIKSPIVRLQEVHRSHWLVGRSHGLCGFLEINLLQTGFPHEHIYKMCWFGLFCLSMLIIMISFFFHVHNSITLPAETS